MKSILVTTDLSSRSDRAVLRAIKLARSYGARLTILHVVDEDSPEILHKDLARVAKKEIFSALEKKTQKVDYKIEIVVGIPHIKILQAALKTKADLIVLGLHRHTNKHGSMIGKVIERVVKSSLKPVLVVKDRSESEYKKVLVAVDFNSHSKSSLKSALSLFSDANFTLVHSYYMPFLGSAGISTSALENEYVKSCEDEINKLLKEATDSVAKLDGKDGKSTNYKVKNKLEKGSIIGVLNKEITSSKPQLLVIGTHGRSGLAKVVSLNVAETFLIDPPCDILVTM